MRILNIWKTIKNRLTSTGSYNAGVFHQVLKISMFFFPFRMESRKQGLPLITVLVILLCLFVYREQVTQDRAYYEALDQYCLHDIDKEVLSALRLVRHQERGNFCAEVYNEVRESERPVIKLKELAQQAKGTGLFATREDDETWIYLRLAEGYKGFDSRVPYLLTKDLSYKPGELDLWNMLTSTFSHSDIWHLLGNLLFFYIFAAAVELVIGHFVFGAFILLGSIGTSLAYSYAMAGVEDALPTVGLSGVVMAMVAALALMLPYARINCLLWIGFIIRVIPVPALVLAIWYIGWDLYDMRRFGQTSGINYVAHISGAIMGAIVGLYYAMFEKKRVRESTYHY